MNRTIEPHSRAYLMDILEYDLLTGVFRWKVDRGTRFKAGQVAGTVSSNKRNNTRQYRYVQIERKQYGLHQLAWLFVHGQWPNVMEWLDEDTLNNAIGNLVDSTRLDINNHRTGMKSDNTSGYSNVIWSVEKKKWRVVVVRYTVCKYCGDYVDKEVAGAKAVEAKSMPFEDFKNL